MGCVCLEPDALCADESIYKQKSGHGYICDILTLAQALFTALRGTDLDA